MAKQEDITQIKISSDEDEINRRLQMGYKIIKIISAKTLEGEHEVIRPCVVLGLPRL